MIPQERGQTVSLRSYLHHLDLPMRLKRKTLGARDNDFKRINNDFYCEVFLNQPPCTREHSILKVDQLAQWYLRLNGFMTISDFVLHRNKRPWGQRTDADICGVRFPLRSELGFVDDDPFRFLTKPFFILAEVTQGECKLNGPWTTPASENIQYVLSAIGAFNPDELDYIAKSLYESYRHDAPEFCVELVAFGNKASATFKHPAKPLLQLEFGAVCRFIFQRFTKNFDPKNDHQHWDHAGKRLWNLAKDNRSSEEKFVRAALKAFGVSCVAV